MEMVKEGEMGKLAKLFEAVTIGTLRLPNRLLMGSMHLGYETAPDAQARLSAFYAERARGEVGLIITGGAAVSLEGMGDVDYGAIYDDRHIDFWQPVVAAVHRAGGRIALQLFHAGRYALCEKLGVQPVSASPLRARIRKTTPRALGADEVWGTVEAFAQGARRARQAGFDGVEVMGSEGYLINQFFSPLTNHRQDEWGGDAQRRMRLGLEVTRRIKEVAGADYPVIFRLSGLDLMEGSTPWEETLEFARRLEGMGADTLSIGVGWHESTIPTVVMLVPRAPFTFVTQAIRQVVQVPVVASNRINDPLLAEAIIREGQADLIAMARPLLADPHLVKKAREGRLQEINTCIACNQACLDMIFAARPATCLVNPAAGRERELALQPASFNKRLAVVGGGPAGLEAARVLAERGHRVTLFERQPALGGQLNLAVLVPGKQEFYETLRYYQVQLTRLGVQVELGHEATATDLASGGFDEVVLATGVLPRPIELAGADLPHVADYVALFTGQARVGRRVAVIGAGGIGVDLAHLLSSAGPPPRRPSASPDRHAVSRFLAQHRIADGGQAAPATAAAAGSGRQVTLMRRGKRVGETLGRTSRWVILQELERQGVQILTDLDYEAITPEGVRIRRQGKQELIPADTVAVAAGQIPNQSLHAELAGNVEGVHLIGGARQTAGLNALQAIYEGTMVGRQI